MNRTSGSIAPFARQMLIPGWDQEGVANARILIAGAGALGNACALNLALTGAGRLAVVDFDTIETSNLSRTALFRRGDEGRRKAAVTAERLKPLMLAPVAVLVPLDADVVWDLGWGVYRRVDLVLGCLDSAEARAAVGMPARALGVPAVFGGLYAHDGSVTIQGVGGGSCVACGFSPAEWREWSRRYSCDQVRRAMEPEALVPATQLTASLVAALMVQEALTLLHGDRSRLGTRLFLNARRPAIERVRVGKRPLCPFHARIDGVEEDSALSNRMTAGELLERLAGWGQPVTVRLHDDFLLACRCKGCGVPLQLWRSRHRTRTGDLLCGQCQRECGAADADPAIASLSELSPATAPAVLDLPLHALGVPALHLLEVAGTRKTGWVELTGDLATVLPGWPEPSMEMIR